MHSSIFDRVTTKHDREAFKCRDCGIVYFSLDQTTEHECKATQPQLTPDQLAYIRAAAARWRMDEAGPLMLEALRKAENALVMASDALVAAWGGSLRGRMIESICEMALESVRAAIAAAE